MHERLRSCEGRSRISPRMEQARRTEATDGCFHYLLQIEQSSPAEEAEEERQVVGLYVVNDNKVACVAWASMPTYDVGTTEWLQLALRSWQLSVDLAS